MYTPDKNGNEPEETKNGNGQNQQPQTDQPENKEDKFEHPDQKKQADEVSHRVTPADPDIVPKDTTHDAGERWESESPAVKGHPQQNIPEDTEKTENPDGDDEDLLKKRDETGIA